MVTPDEVSDADVPAARLLHPLRRPVGRLRSSDQVLDELIRAIRTLRIAPGQTLAENDLARQFGVSRTPVREAMARLADLRLVTVVPQVGTQVAPIRLAEVEDARFMREHLEIAAFSAAVRLPEIDTGPARRRLREQRRAAKAGDLDGFFAADEAMHEEIFVLCGYGGVWQAIQRVKIQMDRVRRLSLPERSTLVELMREHEAILGALEGRDLVAGKRHIRRHARRVLEKAPALQATHPHYFE